MDLSLLDRDCSQRYPSILAAACAFLAQFMLHPVAKPQAVFKNHMLLTLVHFFRLFHNIRVFLIGNSMGLQN